MRLPFSSAVAVGHLCDSWCRQRADLGPEGQMQEPGKDAFVITRLSRQTVSKGSVAAASHPVRVGWGGRQELRVPCDKRPAVPFLSSTLHPPSSAVKLPWARAPALLADLWPSACGHCRPTPGATELPAAAAPGRLVHRCCTHVSCDSASRK